MQFLTIAAAVLQVAGKVQESKAQQSAYKAQIQAMEYNAAINRQRAETARSAWNQREEQQRRAARVFMGKQRAAIAESGLGLGGSNADIERQSEVLAELDALNIRYEGELEASGFLAQSELDTYEAGSLKSQAKQAKKASYLGIASSILSGGSSVYKSWGNTSSAPIVDRGTPYMVG